MVSGSILLTVLFGMFPAPGLSAPAALPASTAGVVAAAFHPLDIGRWWRYQVEEDGRTFDQTVTVKESPRPGCVELYVDSGMRKSRYVVSQDKEGAYLHEVGVRLSLVPLWRTQTFEPPLPFLRSQRRPSNAWSWQGHCVGPGPHLERGEYSSRMVYADDTSHRPLLEVTAAWTSEDGSAQSFVARYQRDVGLVSIESDSYHKELVAHGP
jgi:hypothetical protein